ELLAELGARGRLLLLGGLDVELDLAPQPEVRVARHRLERRQGLDVELELRVDLELLGVEVELEAPRGRVRVRGLGHELPPGAQGRRDTEVLVRLREGGLEELARLE